jgi:hypothetical protein
VSQVEILLLILCASIGLIAIPLGLGLYQFARSPKRSGLAGIEFFDKTYQISIYAYGPDIRSLDDLTARRMSAYRDSGQIIGLSDEEPVFSHTFQPSHDNLNEFSAITRSAVEVRRVNDHDVYYFFNGIRNLTLRSPRLRGIYACIRQGTAKNQAMLLKMSVLSSDQLDSFDDGDAHEV